MAGCASCLHKNVHPNVCSDCLGGTHFKPRNRTIADRIRTMTDEKLAEFIWGIFTIERDPFGDYDPRTVVTQEPRVELRSIEDALDWLRQEATE